MLSRRERRLAAQRTTDDHSETLAGTPATPADVQPTRRSRRRAPTPTPVVTDDANSGDTGTTDEPDDVAETASEAPREVESAPSAEATSAVEFSEPVEAEIVAPVETEHAEAEPEQLVAEVTPDDVPTTTESFEEIIAGAFPIDESSVVDDAHTDHDEASVETERVDTEQSTADSEADSPAPHRGRHGASESAPVDGPRPPRSIRRLAAKTMSISALLAVGLMTVATSVPANALLSADEVQAQKRQSIQQEAYAPGRAQSLVNTASADLALQRDTYGALSVTQAATELGINPENTFTNDPNGTVQWPFSVGVHIGSGYGARPGCSLGCSTNHLGQDFNPGYGAPIQSIADGVVVESTDSGGGFGVKIVIEHVIDGQMIHSLYGHMVPGSRTVQVGDHVSVGQIIGKTGNTGISTGPHMHFEILINGTKHVDPLAWLYENTN